MESMIWIGAALAAIGLVLIVISILRVVAARRAQLDDDALRARIQAALPFNLGGFFLSVLGLMSVVLGVVF